MRKAAFALAACAALAGCFGGAKVPDTLMTLSPAQSRAAAATRSAGEGEAITVVVPTVPRELATLRVPVHQSELAVAYLKNAQWVEMPASLFARLVSETVAATTGRVVLDPSQFTFDPGQRLTGRNLVPGAGRLAPGAHNTSGSARRNAMSTLSSSAARAS